jgi:NTE family protein
MVYQLPNLLALLLVSSLVLAQNAPTARNHPKLGLVLEGGGALGLAHVGVIQWLEEHRIPVSYIAGTSMGGLVGGVYATGRSANEVRDLVEQVNWDLALSGQTPFEDLSFRRKQDATDYPNNLELGLRHGVQLPSGFNSGEPVSLILDNVSLPYDRIRNFDELPIPFACVATDLATNSEHIFYSGPLDLALRSTMSLPGIFTPVRSGDHIYVDGGLLNNLPVDVAKSMGADITLAVHLEQPQLNPDVAMSSFEVLGRSIAAIVAVNEHRSLEKADLIVVVPLQKFTTMDFDDSKAIIKAGYMAAEANAAKLLRLSVDEAAWKEYLAERDARRRQVTTPEFVTVEGVPSQIAHSIVAGMSSYAGKPVNTANLDKNMMVLTGQGPLASSNYSMVERNGKPGLQIEAETKSYMPPIVRPLIVIDGSDYNDVYFSMGARITFLDFGGYRRELRNDVIAGSQYGIATEYYRPFTAESKWFVAPRALVSTAQYPLYNGTTVLTQYRNRLALGGFDVGYGFGRTGELRFGYEGGYQRVPQQNAMRSLLPELAGPTGDARLQYTLNTLNEPLVPHKGESIKFYTKYFNANPGAPHEFPLSELQVENLFGVSDKSTLFLNGFGGTSYGSNTGTPPFLLGGATRFASYGPNELLTDQYFLFQTGYIRKLKKLPPLLGSTIDFFGMVEGGKIYQLPNGPKPPNLPGDVVGAIILETLLGPVKVGGAVGNYGRGKFFFQVGRIF